MLSKFLKYLLPLIGKLLDLVTPDLREMAEGWALNFYEKAKQTDNPADDILAVLILALLDVEEPE